MGFKVEGLSKLLFSFVATARRGVSSVSAVPISDVAISAPELLALAAGRLELSRGVIAR